MKRILNKKTSLSALLYIPTVITVVLLTVLSCSSQKDTVGTADFSHSSQFRKRGEPMTRPLFMKSIRTQLEFPNEYGFAKMYGVPTDSTERRSIVLPDEDYYLQFVEFPGFDDNIFADSIVNRYKYLEATQHLADVVRSNSVRFASVRRGTVDADFRISVPQDLLSKKWRLVLYPTLIQDDETSELQSLLITGDEFASKQELDEENYRKFLGSIVDTSEYVNKFVDYGQVQKDVSKLQNYYWKSFNDDWNKQAAFEQWKLDRANQSVEDAIEKVRDENAQKAVAQVQKDFTEGKDTIGLYEKYFEEYEKASSVVQPIAKIEDLDASDVPGEFRSIFESGRTLDDVQNYSMTSQDSMLISKYKYYFSELSLNEVASARKEEIYKEIVKYPLGEYDNLCLDTIISNADQRFVYSFRQNFKVTPGMEKIRVALKGVVEAEDLSSYTIASSDTLTYYMSNLVGLVDSTLSYSEIKLFRNVYDELSIVPKFKAAQHVLEIEYMDNAAQVDSILMAYNKNRYERGLIIDSVIMKASSSLEGPYERNLDISRKRSFSMKEYLKKVLPPDANVEEVFSARYIGEDWDGMRREVEAHPNIRFKSQIMRLLEDAVFPDATETNIAKRYGVDYGIIYNEIYPRLRKIDIVFNMSRPYMGVADSMYRRINHDYANSLEHLKKQDYAIALETLESYADYNTALCYAGLSQNQKAYDLLMTLEANSNVEYLSALVAYNLGLKDDAAEHLINACNLDFKKIYRIPVDVEAASIVNEFNLQDEFGAILKENKASGLDAEGEIEEGIDLDVFDSYDDERVGRKVDDGELIIVD